MTDEIFEKLNKIKIKLDDKYNCIDDENTEFYFMNFIYEIDGIIKFLESKSDDLSFYEMQNYAYVYINEAKTLYYMNVITYYLERRY